MSTSPKPDERQQNVDAELPTARSHAHRLLVVLVIGIAIATGWLGTRYSNGIDLTANARHSLSDTSVAAVRALDVPVEIIAVLRPNPAQIDALTALVDRFREIKPDIALKVINPDTDPAGAQALSADPGGTLILRAGGREQRLQQLSERTLVSAFRRLGRETDRDIVFITGHEERSPGAQTNEDWSELTRRLAAGGLSTREVSLVAEPHLDDSIDVVVLAAPRLPYFPGEIASLMDYIERGGNLLWLAETPSQAETGPGLDALSNEFGVDVLPGRVIDTASQTLDAETPDFVLLDRFPAHPITLSLASPVLLPQAHALSITPLAGQSVLPLLVTPESSWTERGALEGEIRYDADANEVSGPLTLGVTIERDIGNNTRQRFAVIGDADFAASRFLGNGANATFAEGLLLWLAGDADEVEWLANDRGDSELTLGTRSRIVLLALFLFAIPGLLLTVALLAWRRRR